MSALYVHVPFCRSKCPYCDFYSVTAQSPELARYPELLQRHLEQAQTRRDLQTPLATVFFGGGTPSLLPAPGIGRLLEALAKRPGFTPRVEISLEANPGTVTLETLQGYRAAGINRLSFGIQTLNPEALQLLGRRHAPQQAVAAVHQARHAGFDSISCDLMFGLPGQTPEDLLQDLQAVLLLEPDHLSCYGLAVEDDTPFHHLHRSGGLSLPGEEAYRQLYLAIHHHLLAAGFDHYEISNYARPGHACRHNLVYWRRQAYLGIGAGAHSFHAAGWGERRAVPADLAGYTANLERGEDPSVILESFDRRGAMAETLYLGLRTAEGVAEEDFIRHFGQGVRTAFPAAVDRCGRHLVMREGSWRMDVEGWLIFDHLIEGFL